MFLKEIQTKGEDINIKEYEYDDFVSILNVNSIKYFYSECKKKHLDIKHKRSNNSNEGFHLNREGFFTMMNNVFGKEYKKENKLKKDERSMKVFSAICEKMFNRFKIVNCEIKSEKNKNSHNEYFYVNDITSDQHEIDTYEFSCALCMFPKIDFKEKMKLLFDITDADEDGYINEDEIRNMIFVVNILFCDEEAPLASKSSIINQSLANIKSGQILNMIMKYPGELYRILSSEKYIDFEQFYSAISRIDNYKYIIIPNFINFKSSLFTRKYEPDYEIEKKNLNDFLSLTNEIVSNVKIANSEIIKGSKDIKKLINAKAESKAEMLTKKKKNFVDENKKSFKLKVNSNKITHEDIDNFQEMGKESTSLNLPVIRHKKEKMNTNKLGSIIQNSYMINDTNNLNYNKISNLETFPGKIKIKDQQLNPKEITTRDNRTENSLGERDFGKLSLNRVLFPIREDNKKVYIPFSELMNEIRELSYQKNNANNEEGEEVRRFIKATIKQRNELKTKLKDTGSTSAGSLKFGNFSKNGNIS